MVAAESTIQSNAEVELAPSRVIKLSEEHQDPFTYGSLFCGVDVLAHAWPQGNPLFTVDEQNRPSALPHRPVSRTSHQRFDRVPWKKVLRNSALDVLVHHKK